MGGKRCRCPPDTLFSLSLSSYLKRNSICTECVCVCVSLPARVSLFARACVYVLARACMGVPTWVHMCVHVTKGQNVIG